MYPSVPPRESSSPDPLLKAATLVFLLALTARLAWVLIAMLRNGSALEFPDEALHWDLARNLVDRFELVSEGRYMARMPLYPLLLAPFAAFGDGGIAAARLAQALLGAAAAVALLRLTQDLFGARAGYLAGFLGAIDPFSIFFSNLLLTEAPFIPVLLLLTHAAWRAARPGATAPWTTIFAVGAWGAAALLLRSAALPYVATLWLLLLCWAPSLSVGFRRALMYIAVMAMAFAPWALRNYLISGELCLLSANSGLTLYDSFGPQADGSSNQSFLQKMPNLLALPEAQRDRQFQRLALDEIRDDPWRALALAWPKLTRTWSLAPNAPGYSTGATAWIGSFFTLGVLALAFVALARLLRNAGDHRRGVLLVITPIVVFTLLHCVYVGSVRYRVPMMPFVEALAGAALVSSRPNPTARESGEPALSCRDQN